MIAIGIGSRRGVPADAVLAAIAAALAAAGRPAPEPRLLATAAFKRDEPGIRAAAATLGLDLAFIERSALAAEPAAHSDRVAAHVGVGSVAEAAALAAAGPGARLLVPRIVAGSVTCAIAIGRDPA